MGIASVASNIVGIVVRGRVKGRGRSDGGWAQPKGQQLGAVRAVEKSRSVIVVTF